jgi:MinD-like ATPase involved in chromosome partitioning or flagellar assembly
MARDQKILLCLPAGYAEQFNNEIKKIYPDLNIVGNVPSLNLLLRAFDSIKPDVIIVHVDVPATHDMNYEAVPLNFALDYIRKRDKKIKMILIHGDVKITDNDAFNYEMLAVDAIPKSDIDPREIGRMLGLEQKSDFTHPVISSFSLKGGAGKTVFASNLAVLLKETALPPVQFYSGYLQRQANNLKVLIWDMDMQNGDIGVTFGVPSDKNIFELMTKEPVIDMGSIVKYIYTTPSGVDVLAAPVRFDKFIQIQESQFVDILLILKQLYHVIIFDLPTEVINRPLCYSALKNSSIIVDIFTPDKKGIKSALVVNKIFKFLPEPPELVEFMLNQVDDPRLDIGHIGKLIGSKVTRALPFVKQLDKMENYNSFAIDGDKGFRSVMLDFTQSALPYFYGTSPIAPKASSPSILGKLFGGKSTDAKKKKVNEDV